MSTDIFRNGNVLKGHGKVLVKMCMNPEYCITKTLIRCLLTLSAVFEVKFWDALLSMCYLDLVNF